MKLQRGLGLWTTLIGAALAAAALVAIVIWVNNFIDETWVDPSYNRGHGVGVAEQLAADAPILERVKQERDRAADNYKTAKDNSQELEKTVTKQGQQIQALKRDTDRYAADAHALREKQKAAPSHDAEIAKWRAQAGAAADQNLSLEERLKKADDALDGALRIRRGLPPKGAAK